MSAYPTSWFKPDPRLERDHTCAEHLSPECEDPYKHQACVGDAWCHEWDEPADCTCPHHYLGEPE